MSNENEEVVVEEVEEVEATVEEASVEPTIEEQLEILNEEVTKWKTDYYKVFADMENIKRRMQNEHNNAKKFMMQSFIEELLPVIDNFERSMNVENISDELKNFQKGYEMIYQQLLAVLQKEGVEVIPALGQEFDPNFHQAVMSVEDDSVASNHIVEELQKGYKLKDRVIRASLVKVSQ